MNLPSFSRETSSRFASRRELLALGLPLLAFTRNSPGQQSTPNSQTPEAPTFSTDVRVVNVFATVRNKNGEIVQNLTKDDFHLEEDGRPQTIRYFARQSDLPLKLGLLVDTSGSERRMLPTEREASRQFLEQVLRPEKDQAFLIHFDREVELLQDLTSSREKLEKALDFIDRPQWGGSKGDPSGGGNDPQAGSNGGGNGGGGGGGWPGEGGGRGGGRRQGGGGRGQGGGTALYDAIYLASNDMLAKQSGRKALILLTDGDDRGSKVSVGEAISSSQRSDVLDFSVRIADEERTFNPGFGAPGMGRHGGMGGGGMGGGRGGTYERTDGKKILQQISRETGGGYFEVSKKKSVEEIYKTIEEELRNQYSIGYVSDRSPTDTAFRKITLTANGKNLIVQARNGYYPAATSS